LRNDNVYGRAQRNNVFLAFFVIRTIMASDLNLQVFDRRAALLVAIALAAAAPAGLAQRADTAPWMSGERLVRLMGNSDPATVSWTSDGPFKSRAVAAQYRDLVNGEFVHGYIQAVHDASEGKDWCWNQYKPKPHELDADIRNALQRMSDTQLKQNAANLIVEHWRKKFPCASDSVGRKK
jgi:hypothetical protein